MDISFRFNTLIWDGPLYILRGHRLLFPPKTLCSLKMVSILTNSSDVPDATLCAISSWSSLFAKVSSTQKVYSFILAPYKQMHVTNFKHQLPAKKA